MNDRYSRESEYLTYDHKFHAGNIGDVWKHLALTHCVMALQKEHSRLRILDCHGGAGSYALGASGEWNEGIGKLLSWDTSGASLPLKRFLSTAAEDLAEKGGTYPGSPCILEKLLREQDELICYEIQEPVADALRTRLRSQARVVTGDGMAALREVKESADEPLFVIVDPPWTAKAEWKTIPELVRSFCARCPGAAMLLWYPIKSYTRVAAMLKGWESEGVPAVSLDLITTPLEYQRKRLNGSGILLRGIAAEAISGLANDAPLLAARASVFAETWELRIKSWGRN